MRSKGLFGNIFSSYFSFRETKYVNGNYALFQKVIFSVTEVLRSEMPASDGTTVRRSGSSDLSSR